MKLYITAPYQYGCYYKYLTCFLTWSKPRFNIAIHIFEYVRRSVFINKVFKVIWSEARNAYVVVSEMAKNHGTKSCSTKKLLAMLIATGVMTCASMAPVMAANLAPTDTKIEAGNGASASGEGSVAIGQKAAASGLVAIAIGRDAFASGVDSISIGSDTKAS